MMIFKKIKYCRLIKDWVVINPCEVLSWSAFIFMAENKKSFVLYADIIHTVSILDDSKAGKLFKHILDYVNDKNPISEDMLVNIAFEPIKQQLKRDLQKWDEIRNKRAAAGSIGGHSKAKRSKTKQIVANAKSAKQNVANVAVNGNVNVNVINNSIENIQSIFISKTDTQWTKEFALKEAEKFFNYYSSNNWMVGKNKMKSVTHAVANWILRVEKPVLKNAPKPFDPSKVIW